MSDLDFNNYEQQPQKPPQRNRSFLVIAGVLGAVILVALLAAAAYAMLVLPGQNASRAQEAIQVNAQNTATVIAATSAALTEMAPTDTPEPTSTPEPTATPEPKAVEPQVTEMAIGGGLTEDMAMTATVSALLTQAAESKPGSAEQTAVAMGDPSIIATALPDTGFADEMGIPSIVGLGFLFIVLIVITRRARTARSH
jgi:cytoskeletal protein RodZ